tara:strand:- start:624 stop:809 length:186 start_codon:yes stop_codon:yes gene_type:complete
MEMSQQTVKAAREALREAFDDYAADTRYAHDTTPHTYLRKVRADRDRAIAAFARAITGHGG